MSPYYNMTALADNVTGLDTMVAATNSMTNGYFGLMFLCALWTILFMSFWQKSGDVNRAVAASSYITFVLTVLAWGMNWINGLFLWILLLIMAISIGFTWRYR